MPARRKRVIADSKAGRLDDRRVDAEAGARAHNRAGVLGDVGLEQGEKERVGGRLMASAPRLCDRTRIANRVAAKDKRRTRRKAKARVDLVLWTSNWDQCEKPPQLSAVADARRPAEGDDRVRGVSFGGWSRRATPPMDASMLKSGVHRRALLGG